MSMSVEGVIDSVPWLAADQVELLVGQHVAVGVVHVGAEQTEPLEGRDGVSGAGHADVQRDRQAQLTGEREVLQRCAPGW